MKPISAFVKENNIKLTSEYADHNPNMPDSYDMDHWRVKLRMGRKSMSLFYSKGYWHNGAEPTAEEVLYCLSSDASCVSGEDFEDFCANLGYDSDSRKAERTYKTTVKQTKKLKTFLGEELFEELAYETEDQ